MFNAAAQYGAATMNLTGGILTNVYNNVQAQKREEQARAENYYYNELSAQNADTRTRALYNDLYSPKAQLEQLKTAGLSPSLYYGDGGGISGQAGAMGAGASGISPNVFGLSPIDFSQIALNMANADLMKEEAESIKSKREPEIAKILADEGYTKAATAMTALQSEGQKLHNYLTEHTMNANIYQVAMQANETANKALKVYEEFRNAKLLADLNTELYETNVEKGKQELEQLLSSIKLTDQQRQAIRNDVLKSFDEIAQAWKSLDIQERNQISYTDWLERRIPQINKELEIRLGELDLKKKEFIKDAIIESIRAVAITTVSVASFKGGNNSTTPIVINDNGAPSYKTYHRPKGSAIKEGVPPYKQGNLWEY